MRSSVWVSYIHRAVTNMNHYGYRRPNIRSDSVNNSLPDFGSRPIYSICDIIVAHKCDKVTNVQLC